MNDIPSGLKSIMQDAIEVKLWEIYLLRNRHNILDRLSAYAIDKGPYRTKSDRVTFRFMKFDWDRSLKFLLSEQFIPYEIIRVFKMDIPRHLEKRKVYVAEDDLNILFALETMLEGAGYDVTLSHRGSPMLVKNPPITDLYILDNRMPDINGIEVCMHLKSQAATRHIPVIMISAFRNAGRVAFDAGVDDYLEKPFKMNDLLQLVAKHMTDQKQFQGIHN